MPQAGSRIQRATLTVAPHWHAWYANQRMCHNEKKGSIPGVAAGTHSAFRWSGGVGKMGWYGDCFSAGALELSRLDSR
jgi:hypothetical protein